MDADRIHRPYAYAVSHLVIVRRTIIRRIVLPGDALHLVHRHAHVVRRDARHRRREAMRLPAANPRAAAPARWASAGAGARRNRESLRQCR